MAEKIRYPLTYNPILEYWEKIQNKEVIVSKKVYKTYRKIVNDIKNPTEYFYSAKRANHVLEFAENYCRHSKGRMTIFSLSRPAMQGEELMERQHCWMRMLCCRSITTNICH